MLEGRSRTELPMMDRMVRPLLTMLVLVAATTCGPRAWTSAAEPPPEARIIIRNARLPSLERPEEAALAGRTIVIRDGRIEAILDDALVALRPGDVPIDAKGAFVVPGLVEWRAGSPPSYSELARRPLRGVLDVIARCSEPQVAWRARIAETSPFPAAELLCGPVTRDESSIVPTPDHADAPETRAARAAWIIAHSATLAADAGHPDRGAIRPGAHANLLLLATDPLDDLAAFTRPEQALLAGRPMRRAEVETTREFIENADRLIAAAPEPPPDRRSYRIEASGLHIGRLDLASDGLTGEEFWGPPIGTRSRWRLERHAAGWSLELTMAMGAAPRVRVHVAAEADRTHVRAGLDEPDARVDATSFDLDVEDVTLEPLSLVLRRREALASLTPEEALSLEVVELLPADGQVRAGIRTIRLRRVDRAGPWILEPTDPRRLLRLETDGGADVGWVLLDAQGWPEAAATFADAGITEYRRR